MDLQLYARVLWRFRALILVGALLAAALATLSYVHIGPDGIRYRQSELWSSTMRVGITQQGFPWGRLLAQDDAAAGKETEVPLADPNRLNSLAFLYSQLATSDAVRSVMRRDGPIGGKIVAEPVVVGEVRWVLPLVDITGIATTPEAAIRLARRNARALQTYVGDQQRANKVPPADRVVIEQVREPTRPEIHRPRPKTMPVLIFGAVLFAFVALAFLLERARPTVRGLGDEPQPEPSSVELQEALQRRTA